MIKTSGGRPNFFPESRAYIVYWSKAADAVTGPETLGGISVHKTMQDAARYLCTNTMHLRTYEDIDVPLEKGTIYPCDLPRIVAGTEPEVRIYPLALVDCPHLTERLNQTPTVHLEDVITPEGAEKVCVDELLGSLRTMSMPGKMVAFRKAFEDPQYK